MDNTTKTSRKRCTPPKRGVIRKKKWNREGPSSDGDVRNPDINGMTRHFPMRPGSTTTNKISNLIRQVSQDSIYSVKHMFGDTVSNDRRMDQEEKPWQEQKRDVRLFCESAGQLTVNKGNRTTWKSWSTPRN